MAETIGPLEFGNKMQTVTLAPGTYILTKPITLGITPQTRITGVQYRTELGPLSYPEFLANDGQDVCGGNVFLIAPNPPTPEEP